jgi:hypothetical protein
MRLTFRPTEERDLPHCFAIAFEKFSFTEPGDSTGLLAFWRHCLSLGILNTGVLEEETPAGRDLVAFGMDLFVTEEFAQEVKTTLPPGICRQIFLRWSQGKPAFLTPKEISCDNAGPGLIAATINSGFRPGLNPTQYLEVHAKLAEGFFATHAGFRHKEMFFETFDLPLTTACSEKFGLHIRRDYRGPKPQAPGQPLTLMGIMREERNTTSSSAWDLFFKYTPGRFLFSSGEKKLLHRALLGDSDSDLARSLSTSVWTVKKRWQSIYGKVQKTCPSLLEKKAGSGGSAQAKRRRKLLDYLRQHMEEIRPLEDPPRTSPEKKKPGRTPIPIKEKTIRP